MSREDGVPEHDTLAMLTLKGKMLQKFEPQDERVRWNDNVMIPVSLRRDTDRDDGHKGEG